LAWSGALCDTVTNRPRPSLANKLLTRTPHRPRKHLDGTRVVIGDHIGIDVQRHARVLVA